MRKCRKNGANYLKTSNYWQSDYYPGNMERNCLIGTFLSLPPPPPSHLYPLFRKSLYYFFRFFYFAHMILGFAINSCICENWEGDQIGKCK